MHIFCYDLKKIFKPAQGDFMRVMLLKAVFWGFVLFFFLRITQDLYHMIHRYCSNLVRSSLVVSYGDTFSLEGQQRIAEQIKFFFATHDELVIDQVALSMDLLAQSFGIAAIYSEYSWSCLSFRIRCQAANPVALVNDTYLLLDGQSMLCHKSYLIFDPNIFSVSVDNFEARCVSEPYLLAELVQAVKSLTEEEKKIFNLVWQTALDARLVSHDGCWHFLWSDQLSLLQTKKRAWLERPARLYARLKSDYETSCGFFKKNKRSLMVGERIIEVDMRSEESVIVRYG